MRRFREFLRGILELFFGGVVTVIGGISGLIADILGAGDDSGVEIATAGVKTLVKGFNRLRDFFLGG